ncbi:hypothetical protein F2Q70_00028582 [Brassica cretica]|uniref:MIF4G domain-containing protein n=1 Tax=Brassica cretica TaxID=69181 RepID=A0A8S9LFW4_BRACR|nr:hypothetical protein F2Q70_00028582 [Brassica cretica]
MFCTAESLFYNPVWHFIVGTWDTVVYSPVLDLDSLAESLDMQPPVLPEDGTTRLTAGDEASSSTAVKDTSIPEPIWDDEDTKTFYEAFVPAVLLGEAETKSNTAEVLDDSGTMPDGLNIEQPKEKDEVDKEKAKDAKKEKGKEKDSEKEKGKSLDVANFERLLQRLPGCVSRDLIDQLTNLDPRQSTLVENAYYLCKLPERSARISNVRPPLHQGEYGQIHLIASLTSGLSRHHEEFAVAIVDEVLEEIRVGLELNDYGAQLKRLAYLRFLGELYNYEHAYLIYANVTYGERVKTVVGVFAKKMQRDGYHSLETCGHYFDRGSSKKRHDQFLIHFQRYVLSNGHLPLDIEFDLQKVVTVDPEEQADFDQELKALLQAKQRKLELRGRPALNMTIPMSVFEGSGKDHHHFIGENGEEVMDEENGEPREVQVKGGNKQQTKQMLIPSDC